MASVLMTLAGASTFDRVAVRFAAQTSEVTGSFSTAITCMPRRAKAWESMPIPAVASTTLRTPAAASRLARRKATCGRLACSRPRGVVTQAGRVDKTLIRSGEQQLLLGDQGRAHAGVEIGVLAAKGAHGGERVQRGQGQSRCQEGATLRQGREAKWTSPETTWSSSTGRS